MLSFFRRIRKDLLPGGVTNKYLFYAIGEIVLVVLGILIALQINNWNEKNQSRDTEQELLTGLESELKRNKGLLQDIIEIQEQQINIFTSVIPYFNKAADEIDEVELDSLFGNTIAGWTFNPRYGLLKSIISSGEIRHI